mmetsp:Transcript_58189/g.86496  ORF Transcript_58189/g.86496 Transcript_58189/m.86496 type:complete len:290 (-) Transcript_58189:253-1122(-)
MMWRRSISTLVIRYVFSLIAFFLSFFAGAFYVYMTFRYTSKTKCSVLYIYQHCSSLVVLLHHIRNTHKHTHRLHTTQRLGGTLRQLDYCPTFSITNFKSEDVIYQLDCTNPNSQDVDLFCYPGETFGSNSRCFETNLVRPHCFESRCNEEKHAVEVIFGDDVVLTCDYDGQKLSIPGVEDGILICPNLGEICPDLICRANCCGRGICDYTKKNPECVCFDENNDSPYCAPFELPTSYSDIVSNDTVSCSTLPDPTLQEKSDAASLRPLSSSWITYTFLFIISVAHFLLR